MKRQILAFLALSAVMLSSCGSVGGTADENVIYYEGTAYSRDELSKETIEWLETYNLLSEESKQKVNSIPHELVPEESFTAVDTEP